MHRIRHWSVPYFYNYFKSYWYHKFNRDKPWLSKEINAILSCWIKENDIGFEWGSGSSTCWFAGKAGKITSVEHNPAWHNIVKSKIEQKNLNDKIEYILENPETKNHKYVTSIKSVKNGTLDFCLVDGILRDECALACIPKIKPGGILIIDDIQRYFPDSINTKAPYARKKDEGFSSPVWEKVGKEVSSWRSIRISNRLKDTAIFIKKTTR